MIELNASSMRNRPLLASRSGSQRTAVLFRSELSNPPMARANSRELSSSLERSNSRNRPFLSRVVMLLYQSNERSFLDPVKMTVFCQHQILETFYTTKATGPLLDF